jgi:hypothetical protein
MTTNPLTKKLQMKSGPRALILNAPAGYLERLDPLPEGVELVVGTRFIASAPEAPEAPEGQFDFVQLFVKNKEDLQKFLPVAAQAVRHDALLWIAYPKGGAKAGTDLNRDILWDAVLPHQLTGVTLVSLDDVWSAMRFRPPERVGQ